MVSELRQRFPASTEARLLEGHQPSALSPEQVAALEPSAADPRVAMFLATHAEGRSPTDQDRLTVEALRLAPSDARALRARVRVLAEASRWPEAMDQAKALVRLAPWWPEAMALASAVLVQQQRCADAALLAERAKGAFSEEAPAADRESFEASLRKALDACKAAPVP